MYVDYKSRYMSMDFQGNGLMGVKSQFAVYKNCRLFYFISYPTRI